MRPILITGGHGLIGTALQAALAAVGRPTVGLDLRGAGRDRGDVRIADHVRRVIEGCAGVVHLAAVSRVIDGERDPETCRQTNIGGLRNILEQAERQREPPWVVFASSREVYGQAARLPAAEDTVLAPLNVYGRTKVEGERMIADAAARGLRATVVRLSSVYGSTRDHSDRVVPAFARAAVVGGEIRVEGFENVRTFIAVRNEHAHAGGHRCRVTLQLTFLKANVAELSDIVRLASELGVDRAKGHHLWAHFDEIKEQSMRRSPEAISRWNAAVVRAREVANTHRLPSGEPVVLENIFVLDEHATSDLAPGGACPFLGQEAWISASGRFDPCCAPDAKRRTLGEFGNLNERGLLDVWNGAPYRQLVASYRTRALCVGCNMRRPPA